MDIDQQMQNVLNVTGDDPLSDVMEDEGEKNRRITQDATMWGDINDDGTIDEIGQTGRTINVKGVEGIRFMHKGGILQ